jgi:broad specificity phosphatase PhoE
VTRIIILRHGRTEWNRVEKFRGRADIGLDRVGIEQAEAAAKRIGEWPISAVYSSPLQRAMATSDIVASRLGIGVNLLPEIVDIDYGEWQGLSTQEVIDRYHSLYSKWIKDPDDVKFPGGESFSRVRDRISRTVEVLIQQHPKESIVLVTHKVICQVFVLNLLALNSSHFWQITQDVCAMNLFEVRGGIPSALFLNDTCHLSGLN